jgi:iron complex outermembrane recepter protein
MGMGKININMKIYLNIIILLLVFLTIANANSDNVISGAVKDDKTGEPIPGANIFLPELKRGGVSNLDGTFMIRVNERIESVLLQVSVIGYKTEVIKVNSGSMNSELDIRLMEEELVADEVIVSAGRIGSRSDIPVQVDKLGVKDILSDGEVNIMSSMARIPGVEQISYGNAIGKPVIRGLSFSRILTIYQANRLENHQWGADHGLGLNDLMIESVEVIKGPASFLYGSGAIGGVIYMVDERNAPVGSMVGSLNSTFYSSSLGFRQLATFKETRESGFFYGAGVAVENHADYVDGNGRIIGNSRFNTHTFRMNSGLHKNWGSLRLDYTYHRQNLGIVENTELEETLATTRGDRSRQLPFQKVDDHVLTLNSIIPFWKGRFEGNLGYHFNDRREIEDDFHEIDLGLRQSNMTYDLKYVHESGSRLEHILGTQGYFLRNNNYEDAGEILIPDAKIIDGSLYYLATLKTKNSTFQTGLRYDSRRAKADASAPLFVDFGYTLPGLDARKFSTSHSGLSGSMGSTFNFTRRFNVKANFSSGFRAPDLAEMFSHGEHPGTQRFEVGNVNFTREQNYQLDLAFYYKNDGINLEVSPFYNFINNYIFFTPTDTQVPGTDLVVWRFHQDDARLYGFETTVAWRPFKDNRWIFDNRFSMVRGRNTETGQNMPMMPSDRLLSSLTYNFPNMGSTFRKSYVRTTWNYVFEQNRLSQQERASFGTNFTPAYNLWGLSLGSSITVGNQQVDVDLTANNLLNRAYVDHLNFLRPFNILNGGRNVSLNVNIPLNF